MTKFHYYKLSKTKRIRYLKYYQKKHNVSEEYTNYVVKRLLNENKEK